MTNGIFKRLDKCGHARAADVMSTHSATGFEWSVKLFGTSSFHIGIATELKTEQVHIPEEDENAIVYCSSGDSSSIKIGKNIVQANLTKHKNEDIIRFRFRPHAKKLDIDLVSLNIATQVIIEEIQ